MRVPWSNSKSLQLDLLSADPAPVQDSNPDTVVGGEPNLLSARTVFIGQPLMVSTASLFEDPNNPRTEFPQVELEELAEDTRRHGILQPSSSIQPMVRGGIKFISVQSAGVRPSSSNCSKFLSSCATRRPIPMRRSLKTRSATV
jgi:hypothetical protein